MLISIIQGWEGCLGNITIIIILSSLFYYFIRWLSLTLQLRKLDIELRREHKVRMDQEREEKIKAEEERVKEKE